MPRSRPEHTLVLSTGVQRMGRCAVKGAWGVLGDALQ